MTPLSKLTSYSFEPTEPYNLVNYRNAAGWTLLEVFCINGNLNGLKLMRELGADLKAGSLDSEPPIMTCLRWRHASLVRYILSLKMFSLKEIEEMFEGTTDRRLVAAVREFYPKALRRTSDKGLFSNFLIF